ncbi:ABC transporter substrate-binding protein [Sphingomonas sp. AP4-R1]|uniref:ABC transporter substrate-binding protein n=1 Tax=Sphingomonas sp. AP4-R1 TaxID=2735134 RepID=UPI001493CA69|nr:ABC transporter substrate-binding protein [Sphingomonas sp. AP4-R1]QJU58177.1 ABC transporter substrate-binding protein [Sphingomonas sp. AP4-R1]
MQMTDLNVIAFPGGFNWPLWVGQKIGCFETEGLNVVVHATRDSRSQMSGLQSGDYQIAFTGFDNVLAYASDAGERAPLDPVALMGIDNGLLYLVGQSRFGEVSELRGQRIAVDALSTGYAFVLFALLEAAGLSTSDVQLESIGGVAQRFEALIAGSQEASLLVTPFDLMAQTHGLKIFERALNQLGAYQGVVAAATRAWLADNRDTVVRFIAAFRRALDWMLDRANRTEALEVLRDNLPALPEAILIETADRLSGTDEGFFPMARLDRAGMETALQLRLKFAPRNLGPVDQYFDENPWIEADRRIKGDIH